MDNREQSHQILINNYARLLNLTWSPNNAESNGKFVFHLGEAEHYLIMNNVLIHEWVCKWDTTKKIMVNSFILYHQHSNFGLVAPCYWLTIINSPARSPGPFQSFAPLLRSNSPFEWEGQGDPGWSARCRWWWVGDVCKSLERWGEHGRFVDVSWCFSMFHGGSWCFMMFLMCLLTL